MGVTPMAAGVDKATVEQVPWARNGLGLGEPWARIGLEWALG
jgi:hypothetical protein